MTDRAEFIKTVSDLASLSSMWLMSKTAEATATADRRNIEDRIRELTGVRDDVEGTESVKAPGYKVKIVSRLDRKVDADKVQELAAEHGLTTHLSSLFRWKPELNMSAWKAADDSITRPLAAAITTKPGRPSFSIEQE
jgi:hypothetical protein